MIQIGKKQLSNGLRIVVNEDDDTPMVAVNLLYDVGSRDESASLTGLAHLFEHLMFSGTVDVPDFDEPVQLAGGENNAFTNADITNYYQMLPAINLETAIWLEADRLKNLRLDPEKLRVQKKVVTEEFKETCLGEPFGESWHHLYSMAYQKHPYRWPTIGLNTDHIQAIEMPDAQGFFKQFYHPGNAILSVSGGVKYEEVCRLAERYFGEISPGPVVQKDFPKEEPQSGFREKQVRSEVDMEAVYLAFHMPARRAPGFFAMDLISDILGNGPSARLNKELVDEQKIFATIDAYVTGSVDEGLLIIEGKLRPQVSVKKAMKNIWQVLDRLWEEPIPPKELKKYQNKFESTLLFSESSILSKAINMAFYELLGDANLINREMNEYLAVTPADVQRAARQFLRKENCSALYYTT